MGQREPVMQPATSDQHIDLYVAAFRSREGEELSESIEEVALSILATYMYRVRVRGSC